MPAAARCTGAGAWSSSFLGAVGSVALPASARWTGAGAWFSFLAPWVLLRCLVPRAAPGPAHGLPLSLAPWVLLWCSLPRAAPAPAHGLPLLLRHVVPRRVSVSEDLRCIRFQARDVQPGDRRAARDLIGDAVGLVFRRVTGLTYLDLALHAGQRKRRCDVLRTPRLPRNGRRSGVSTLIRRAVRRRSADHAVLRLSLEGCVAQLRPLINSAILRWFCDFQCRRAFDGWSRPRDAPPAARPCNCGKRSPCCLTRESDASAAFHARCGSVLQISAGSAGRSPRSKRVDVMIDRQMRLPKTPAFQRVRQMKLDHGVHAAAKSSIDRLAGVGGRCLHNAGVMLQPLQQIIRFEVGEAVVRRLHFRAARHQRVAFVEQEHHVEVRPRGRARGSGFSPFRQCVYSPQPRDRPDEDPSPQLRREHAT